MKKLLIATLLATTFFACKKEETTLNDTFDPTGKTLLASGTFVSDAHGTSGNAKVYTDGAKKFLVFENFKTDSGPDLDVNLATSNANANAVKISDLKATAGNFYFEFAQTVDEKSKNKVLIWCEDFSVLFGHADLK